MSNVVTDAVFRHLQVAVDSWNTTSVWPGRVKIESVRVLSAANLCLVTIKIDLGVHELGTQKWSYEIDMTEDEELIQNSADRDAIRSFAFILIGNVFEWLDLRGVDKAIAAHGHPSW